MGNGGAIAWALVMFERFAEEARRATALASTEARQFGHDFIGTEHLLLGLLATDEGVAFSVLTELEVTLDDARRKVTERVHPSGRGSTDSPPFTPLAKKSLERALREALALKAEVIGSEHLLLGLVAVPDGGGARILAELAVSLEQVREAVLARVGHPVSGPSEAPLEQTKAPVTSKTLRRWATQGLLVLRPPGPASMSPEVEVPDPSSVTSEMGPLCRGCQAPLATSARYRMVTAAPGVPIEGEGAGEVVVRVVYCDQCGTALGIA